jgi:ferric-dicitrate binding protein FerR (iron transport regulator)
MATNDNNILLSKYFKNECTREEFDQALNLILEPNSGITHNDALLAQWNSCMLQSLSEEYTEANITEKPIKVSLIRKHIWKYAAILLFLLASIAVVHILVNSNSEPNFTQQYLAGNITKKIQLNDGSNIKLGAGSQLYVADNFSDERDLKIEGEASFDVVNINNQSFQVHTSELLVNVIGTSFNVRDFEDEPTIVVTVKSGIVETEFETGSKTYTNRLKKDMQLVYNKLNHKVKVYQTNASKLNANNESTLYFKNTPLYQVITDIERYHNVTIHVDSESINHLQISGEHNNDKAEALLEAICFINDLELVKLGTSEYRISKH